MPYTIAIAGSTHRTRACTECLLESPDFEVVWTLSPSPRIIGRDTEPTKNPIHEFSETHSLPHILVQKKIDDIVQSSVLELTEEHGIPDLLLVVDFGYIVPDWLLELADIAPLNIHPSALPKWRGSSPGQFVLLAGEPHSAITLMVMNQRLDQGPIIAQLGFAVDPTWTQDEYYDHAFEVMCHKLPHEIRDFAEEPTEVQPQPLETPTPIARKLTKKDSFVSWEVLKQAQAGEVDVSQLNPLLQEMHAYSDQENPENITVSLLEQACRAFSPWPGLWTQVPTAKGQKRMKILSCTVDNNTLVLNEVHLEGKQPAPWNQVQVNVSQ